MIILYFIIAGSIIGTLALLIHIFRGYKKNKRKRPTPSDIKDVLEELEEPHK